MNYIHLMASGAVDNPSINYGWPKFNVPGHYILVRVGPTDGEDWVGKTFELVASIDEDSRFIYCTI